MRRLLAVAAFTMTLSTPAAAAAPAPAVVPRPVPTEVQSALTVLGKLAQYGYVVNTPARAERAIRHWQKANGLTVDGIVGPETLASLSLPATGTVPAVRVDPPAAPVPQSVEGIIREVWPDELEDKALAIAYRESRLQPEVINRNGDATGLFQVMWSVHRSWLCPQLGVCSQSQLQDARTNAVAAYALYQRAGSWRPWQL